MCIMYIVHAQNYALCYIYVLYINFTLPLPLPKKRTLEQGASCVKRRGGGYSFYTFYNLSLNSSVFDSPIPPHRKKSNISLLGHKNMLINREREKCILMPQDMRNWEKIYNNIRGSLYEYLRRKDWIFSIGYLLYFSEIIIKVVNFVHNINVGWPIIFLR